MELIQWWRIGYSAVAIVVLFCMVLEFKRRRPTLSSPDLFWALALLGGSVSMIATSLESVYFNDHLSVKTPLFISTTLWCAIALWISRKTKEEIRTFERGIMNLKLKPALYDNLKWVTQILLPAIGAFYFTLSDIWNLPNALEVVGSITGLVTFLGIVLGLSSAQYKRHNEPFAGVVEASGADPLTGHPDLKLVLHKLPADLVENDTVTFRVKNVPAVEAQDTLD